MNGTRTCFQGGGKLNLQHQKSKTSNPQLISTDDRLRGKERLNSLNDYHVHIPFGVSRCYPNNGEQKGKMKAGFVYKGSWRLCNSGEPSKNYQDHVKICLRYHIQRAYHESSTGP